VELIGQKQQQDDSPALLSNQWTHSEIRWFHSTCLSDAILPSVLQIRAAVLALCLAGASAFMAPTARVAPRTVASAFDVKSQIGVQAPLGYYDPLGFLDGADEEKFTWWRNAETKHGRIAMAAVAGHIVTAAGVRLPGDIAYGKSFASVPGGLKAFFGPDAVPTGGVAQMFCMFAILEIGYTYRQSEIEQVHLDKSKWSAATIEKKKAVELNQGRAAMMGIWGLVVHEMINGNPYVINELLGMHVAV